MNRNLSSKTSKMKFSLFPMHGTRVLNSPMKLREKEQLVYDASVDKVNKRSHRQMYKEKLFMEEMLKAKNMASGRK